MNTDKIYAEHIANEYALKQTSKVKALRKLDAKAKSPARIFAYTMGIASSLVMGIGMCLAMEVIGDGTLLTVGIGVAVGCLGIVGVSVNYPIYKKILSASKNKYASDIIKLANDIASEE